MRSCFYSIKRGLVNGFIPLPLQFEEKRPLLGVFSIFSAGIQAYESGVCADPPPSKIGGFASWALLFSSFDCSLGHIRGQEDSYNVVTAGFLAGAALSIRGGWKAAGASGLMGIFSTLWRDHSHSASMFILRTDLRSNRSDDPSNHRRSSVPATEDDAATPPRANQTPRANGSHVPSSFPPLPRVSLFVPDRRGCGHSRG